MIVQKVALSPSPWHRDHRQLARVGIRRSIMPNAEPPAVLGVRIAVGARPKVRTGRIAAHAGATRQQRQSRAQKSVGENDSPATVHDDGNPFLLTVDVAESILLNGAREFYRPSAFLGTPAHAFPCNRTRCAARRSRRAQANQGNEQECAVAG